MEFKDYYAALGVARDAPAEAIKKAYRKLARKYHPDVSKEPDAAKRMAEINEANTVLSDAEKRAAYDQLGKGPSSGRDFSGRESAEFSDFFSEIFGRRGAQGAAFESGMNDQHARVLLDLEDAYSGPERQLSLGARTLSVKIPKGIREGQIIRLAGQGAAINGEKPGDLLLEVAFKPHARLRPEGRDLHLTLPVAPWEAALGAVVPVDLPGGTLNVRIPVGAQPGKQLRLRGKGIPSNPPGDVLMDIVIVAPPAATPKAKELYESLQKEMNFDPRKDWGREP